MSTIAQIFQGYLDDPAFAEDMDTRLILGEGAFPAAIAIVGEAPDDMAARTGHPFYGPGFQMLTQFCMLANLPASCWFTNVVKVRPYDPGDRRYRAPNAEEVAASRPYLMRELAAAETEIVLALGTTAGELLTGRRLSMKRDHGLFYDGEAGRTVFVTHHPAAAMFRGPAKQELRDDIALFAKEVCA